MFYRVFIDLRLETWRAAENFGFFQIDKNKWATYSYVLIKAKY